jgi:hypothetical protein
MTGDSKLTGSAADSGESKISTAGYDYEVKFKISRSARNKLPENFNIQEIGSIDLKEADAIANEDILFLTESDLIEGLEDFDLIPLNEDINHQKIQDTELKISRDPIVKPQILQETVEVSPLKNDVESPVISSAPEQVLEKEKNINYEIPHKEDTSIILSASSNEPVKNEIPVKADDISTEAQKEEISESDKIQVKDEKNINTDNNNELIDFEVSDEIDESSKLDSSLSIAETPNVAILSRKDEVELIDDDEKIVSKDKAELLPDDSGNEVYHEIKPSIEKEKLPDWAYSLESYEGRTYFIDDESVEIEKRVIVQNFEEKELEKITSRIIETYEVKPKILVEADIEDDKENIAYTSSSIAPVFDDLLVDFEDDELKYRDDDLEFIHSAIIEEDFSKYLRLIDEYHGLSGERKVTAAVELLGLTNDEIDEMTDVLYTNDYKEINLDEVFSVIKNQSALNYKDAGRNINCTYLISDISSLLDEEKKSIEADISSEFALIYEEDVEQLKSHLKQIFVETKPDSVKVVEEIHDITDRVVILEDEDDVKRFVKEIPEHKRDDLVRLMKYLDGMFEKLPENAVKNFAESEYFNLYVKVLNDLGI